MNEINITRRMNTITAGYFSKLLTRDDFYFCIERLNESESENKSNFQDLRKNLVEMFKKCNIDCDSSKDSAYYEELLLQNEGNLCNFEDIETEILKLMLDSFKEYPTPTEYMQRIVDRLSDPNDDWGKDTLRLRILKQFIKYGNYLSFEKKSLKENGKVKKETVSLYGGKKYINDFVSKKLDFFRTDSSNSKKSSKEPIETVLENVDDSIFSVLTSKSTKKEDKKPEGKYGLLRLADDLAKGQFRPGGATKRDLYMFAIVYNMTYCCDMDKADDYMYSDIEKNLFTDYYANNLMRFITQSYIDNSNSYETNPSGQEINYKNFAEMVYIYFISKTYEPLEKLKLASEMIERLVNNTHTVNDSTIGTKTSYYLATEKLLDFSEAEFEDFISNNYDCSVSFETNSDGKNNVTRINIFHIQTSKRTAYDDYLEFADSVAVREQFERYKEAQINDPKKWQDQDEKAGKGKKHVYKRYKSNPKKKALKLLKKYGLWFADDLYISKEDEPDKEYQINKRVAEILFNEEGENEKSKAKGKAFTSLLDKMNKFLSDNAFVIVDTPEKLTRTASIAAYYYHYNAIKSKKGKRLSFFDVYNDYTNPNGDLGILLSKAHFQPISDKNLFDMAVIFSSYAYLID
ncbi:hypothetical protein [Ruminococcus sp.]|uniref:hypothetical protein n=1 Tax=Ruminococcus sp. TaxID=41978 RepID=UPI0025D99EFC|nr:hypothetical protein [Ruminococcus sp.]